MPPGRSIFPLKTWTSFLTKLKAAMRRNKISSDSVGVMVRHLILLQSLGFLVHLFSCWNRIPYVGKWFSALCVSCKATGKLHKTFPPKLTYALNSNQSSYFSLIEHTLILVMSMFLSLLLQLFCIKSTSWSEAKLFLIPFMDIYSISLQMMMLYRCHSQGQHPSFLDYVLILIKMNRCAFLSARRLM